MTMQHIFMNNFQLCSEINERVVQHFVHCIETHGRSVHYLKFLQTIVKAENKFIKKCQDIVMAEVCRPDKQLVYLTTSPRLLLFCPIFFRLLKTDWYWYYLCVFSWWQRVRMCWCSIMTGHLFNHWFKWCALRGSDLMRAVHSGKDVY